VSSTEILQQLKEADIASPLVLVSDAQSYDVESVHEKLADSPNDRANAMRGDITDLGIGAAKGPDIAGKPSLIVFETFVAQLPPPDPVDVKAKLSAAIAQKRSGAGKAALESDAMLNDIAQRYADKAAAAGGPLPREQETELMAPLYKASTTVTELQGFVPSAEAAVGVAEQPAVVGDSKLVGVGVSVGRSPQFGKNSPFVMVLLGTRHTPVKVTRKKH
jgi:hypothetical protein